jgi:hypothetical protein
MKQELRPYKTDRIKHGGNVIVLKEHISCNVDNEDANVIISNAELNITAWASSHIEAEEAFNFTFYSLFKTYCLESDMNLSGEAIVLKNKLSELIAIVIVDDSVLIR